MIIFTFFLIGFIFIIGAIISALLWRKQIKIFNSYNYTEKFKYAFIILFVLGLCLIVGSLLYYYRLKSETIDWKHVQYENSFFYPDIDSLVPVIDPRSLA
jgi:hypothetical protein